MTSWLKCEGCGGFVPDDADRCPGCGTVFEQGVVRCGACSAWTDRALPMCNVCRTRFETRRPAGLGRFLRKDAVYRLAMPHPFPDLTRDRD